jgi:SpoVK/Ycf46/Vps4 family AAA+-type ATPase
LIIIGSYIIIEEIYHLFDIAKPKKKTAIKSTINNDFEELTNQNNENEKKIFLDVNQYQNIINDYKNKRNAEIINKMAKISLFEKTNYHLLISGDPGTGKTIFIRHLVQSIFEDKSYSIYYKKIPTQDIIQMWINSEMTALKNIKARIESVYKAYIEKQTIEKKETKKLVFLLQFDEAESIFRKRQTDRDDIQSNIKISTDTTTNGFLNMIDHYSNDEKRFDVVFALTTNSTEKIDEAVTRSGRIENHYMLELPNKDTKNKYLEWYLKSIFEKSTFNIQLDNELKENIVEESKIFADIIKQFHNKYDAYLNNNVNQLTALLQSKNEVDVPKYSSNNKIKIVLK